ncbi:MAG: sulfotransferase [Piscinibacter sp.]|uniref:sulfotransferase family protein n=1 Tax=Piscinibacter sp. TaxID=1903157 RepID=UPI0025830F24|nr:sulfotransferase [Piscinibacter sp.]MCW5666908.1 sulfotransferase [Piscinibacter sp.]
MRHRIDKAALTLARGFLLNPQEYWPDRPRHVSKLNRALKYSLGDGERVPELVDEILAIARLRTAHAPAPIYLPNAGSSGSHWLEAMLARAADVHACGEVYLPKPVIEQLQAMTPADAGFFLNAVYVAHSRRVGPALVSGYCVNSAHVTNVGTIAALTPGAKKVLLIRHPVDVVMSRTLRKPAHRADVAPDMDDRAYLDHNCELVERFHAALAPETFDAVVRYEDLLTQPVEALTALTGALGLAATPESIRHAAESTSRSAVVAARAQGGNVATNLFAGEAREDAELETVAVRRLASLSRRLGYDEAPPAG